jgi:hypothetical protein
MRSTTFLIGATLAAGCFARAQAQVPAGRPAPPFRLRQLNHQPLALSSLRGKVVLLDFWGPT